MMEWMRACTASGWGGVSVVPWTMSFMADMVRATSSSVLGVGVLVSSLGRLSLRVRASSEGDFWRPPRPKRKAMLVVLVFGVICIS